MTMVIICGGVPGPRLKLWCPYCDEIKEFYTYEYYDDVTCPDCLRRFPPHFWPRGFDIKTGKLKTPRRGGPTGARR